MNAFQTFHLSEKFLAILLGAAVLQFVNAHVMGLADAIASSWIISLTLVIAALALIAKSWQAAPSAERVEFTAPWKSPIAWVFLVVMVWQIASYPPMMSDSLCYRLPRIFLWLQEGGITRTGASDGRILEMPYGWEILALPLVAVNQVTFVALVNLGAWIVVVQLFHHWAILYGATGKQARWISLALATAPFHLLQATSSANDLFTAACLLIALHFVLSFSRNPQWPKVFLSLIALMMACGIKPQFLVLGLGWGVWWLFSPGRPWKHTGILPLVVFGSLALLVSPLPAFLSNYFATGSLMGSGMESSMESGSLFQKVVISSSQFLSVQLQLPLMPGAEKIGGAISSLPFLKAGKDAIPFEHGLAMIPTIDWASFGLIHFTLLVLGAVLAFKTADPELRWLVLFVLIGYSIAAATVVPSTIGRSFAGFVALLTPLAICGLIRIQTKWLTPVCAAAIVTGFTAMILNPSSPAWPSRLVEQFAQDRGKTGVADKLGHYHAYQERAETGAGFLDPVPVGEKVAVLVRGYTPIVGLWTPDWRRHRIEFTHQTSADNFQAGDCRWLLIADNVSEQFPGTAESYRELDGWREVSSASFRPLLSVAPETWTLYHRR